MRVYDDIIGYVDQLISVYNFMENDQPDNLNLIQSTKLTSKGMTLSVKINRAFGSLLKTAGLSEDMAKVSYIIDNEDKNKIRFYVRFKIKDCEIEKFDFFSRHLRDRGLYVYMLGKNIHSLHDGPEVRSLYAREDIKEGSIDGRPYVHKPGTEGKLILKTIKRVNIQFINQGLILESIPTDPLFVKMINEQKDFEEYKKISDAFPKYTGN